MGLPVVTIDVPPLNEVVRDREEGLLHPAGDGDALASRLKALAGDPDLRKRLGLNARARVTAHYSWQAHCASLDHILRSITHGK
jgi:glycosyltransferase involved in cell wall biosynthesis